MQRVDILIGVVLLVAAAGSIGGVLVYESTPALSNKAYDVTWIQSPTSFGPVDANHQGQGSHEFETPIVLLSSNITRVEFTVEVTGSGPRLQAVTATVTITDPQGNEHREQGTLPMGAVEQQVQIPVNVVVAPLPSVNATEAADEDAALADLAGQWTNDTGTGNWRVAIEFSSAGTEPVQNENHGASVRGRYLAYSAQVSASVPDIGGSA